MKKLSYFQRYKMLRHFYSPHPRLISAIEAYKLRNDLDWDHLYHDWHRARLDAVERELRSQLPPRPSADSREAAVPPQWMCALGHPMDRKTTPGDITKECGCLAERQIPDLGGDYCECCDPDEKWCRNRRR